MNVAVQGCCNLIKEVVDIFVTGDGVEVEVLERCQAERSEHCSSDVVLRIDCLILSFEILIRALQAALVNSELVDDVVNSGSQPTEISACTCGVEEVVSSFVHLVLSFCDDSSNRFFVESELNLIEIFLLDGSFSFVEAVVCTGKAELQSSVALLEGRECDG